MSKFAIGDHVRVTAQEGVPGHYFDRAGYVDEKIQDGDFSYGIQFEGMAYTVAFHETELVLADGEPHE